MALDFQQLHNQIRQMGAQAVDEARQLEARRAAAEAALQRYADDLAYLHARVEQARALSPALRCAAPARESLTTHAAPPPAPHSGVLIAADGSQINPDRHKAVDYYLLNLGAIALQLGSGSAPTRHVQTLLYYGEALYRADKTLISEEEVARQRDLLERQMLVELVEQYLPAAGAPPLVLTLTDGPLELWGSKAGERGGDGDFRRSLALYIESLEVLCRLGAATAGYVDKPRADLLVRLLEVAQLPAADLNEAGLRTRPFFGVTDADLLRTRLAPGERSAVFRLQSQSFRDYTGALTLHFFYINVGRAEKPWLARVEIPQWVAESRQALEALHAVLLEQARMLGEAAYPYLLHRAHEVAVVSHDEQAQATQMIVLELRRRGLNDLEDSHKQHAKDVSKR
ncbi:MAG: DNA double-strand break repair nuclease NurA [Anaerolineales bacterium]